MGKRMNRFLSGNGGTGGLVREQQRTNDLLDEILRELKKRPAPRSEFTREAFEDNSVDYAPGR